MTEVQEPPSAFGQDSGDKHHRSRRFPPITVENPDELEIDEVIRIMGRTPPPPERQEQKARRNTAKG
ncbi:MAG TPA: hypothetical protein VFB34_01835 [Chloroflexota bacterium]|nr:hypothetical protein [Chloroflexota bacterium]